MNDTNIAPIPTEARIFFDSDLKVAENMLNILAFISADFWSKALLSESFVVNGKLVDYVRGYKNRVQKILPDPNAESITLEQITTFRKKYLSIAKEIIFKYLADDKSVANLLGQQERVPFDLEHFGERKFDFGGWDNDPTGAVAVAMHSANIKGMMRNAKYTKKRITLLSEDGSIRIGWFKSCPILYQVR